MTFIPPITRRITSEATLTVGNTHTVKCGVLPKAIGGRPCHVESIDIEADIVLSHAGGTQLVPGELVNSVFKNIVLRHGEHRFVSALDGDEVNFLGSQRAGEDIVTMPADIPNAVDAAVARSARVRIQCTPGRAGDSGQQADGAIPTALLHEDKNGELSFEVGATLIGAAGVAVVSVSNLVVTARLLVLDHLRVPTAWRMRAYDEKQKDFTVKPDGRALVVAIRDRKTAAGVVEAPDHSGYAGLTLTIGDSVIYTGRTPAEVADYHNRSLPVTATPLTTSAPEFLPLYVAPPGERRSKMLSGKVRLEMETVADSQDNVRTGGARVLIHETGKSNHPTLHVMLLALGAPVDATNPTKSQAGNETRFANRDGRTSRHSLSDVLDQAAYWSGMTREGYSIPDRKLSRNLARM